MQPGLRRRSLWEAVACWWDWGLLKPRLSLRQELLQRPPSCERVGASTRARQHRVWVFQPISLPDSGKYQIVRRALREALLNSPGDLASVIERLMAEDLASSAPRVGLAQHSSARAWVEHRSHRSCRWNCHPYSRILERKRASHTSASRSISTRTGKSSTRFRRGYPATLGSLASRVDVSGPVESPQGQ